MKRTKDIENTHGERATFIVNVLYRQHASWQGQITWVDKNKKENFRSILELIKLIDSASDDEELKIEEGFEPDLSFEENISRSM